MKNRFLTSLALFGFALASSAALAAPGQWLQSARHGDIAYFLGDAPNQILRYDLAARNFLSPVALPEAPSAFTVDGDGIYVSFGRVVRGYQLDGSGQYHISNTPADVTAMTVSGDHLFLHTGVSPFDMMSVNKASGLVVDTGDFFYRMRGLSVAPTAGRIYGTSNGVSPADILYVAFNADGTFGVQNDSPHHGDYPIGDQTYIFPNESRVIDDSGVVYAADTLNFSGSLGGPFDFLDFYLEAPVVLRDGTIYGYTQTLQETGLLEPQNVLHSFYVSADDIIGFYDDGAASMAVEILSLLDIAPPDPGDPVDPNGLAYVPDAVALGSDNTLYLLSADNQSVFRWSHSTRSYLPSIPLTGIPIFMAYSRDTHRLYLGYDDTRITQIDLGSGVSEQFFASVPQSILGLATAGQYVFACDPSGAWVSHFTYHPDGSLISQEEWNYFSTEYIWSEVQGRMYFLRDSTSPNDILWEEIGANGVIGAMTDSPFHSSNGMQHPIRVAPDGSAVLLGSGWVFDPVSLELISFLPNEIDDAAWLGSELGTMRLIAGQTQAQEWESNLAPAGAYLAPGEGHALVSYSDRLVIISIVDGIPEFYDWFVGTNDVDGDGVDNASDVFPLDPAESADSDGDSVGDNSDNCTLSTNTDQRDTDGDNIGNACDQDIAPAVNDCAVNFIDLGALKAAFFSTPGDPNWNPDADFNGDDTVNFVDLGILRAAIFAPPGPSAEGCN